MTLFEAVILGIIQGLTEFIPVSSSGHLALGQILFGLEQDGLLFEMVVHIGTLIPVVIIFWKDIWAIIRRPFQKMTLLLIIGTIPVVIVGLLLEDIVGNAFTSLMWLAVGFVITGVTLMFADRIRNNKKKSEDITILDAAIVGIAQAIAIFPGISRSGSTVMAALGRGIEREAAAKFSFLLSIPVVLGATVLQVVHLIRDDGHIYATNVDFWPLALAFVAAMLSGYLAIKLMLMAIKKAKLRYFAYYVLILAVAIVVGMVIFN
ncbi:MAG: undecaprenyl-diphosphate phosphatase [Defluviitaleaceae bacterium]|nr:undecaprenyl-diphosphate phosphatase [Defluviitaleaceae bacterium]